MGASLTPAHRIFSVRNPFARAVFITTAVLFLAAVTLRADHVGVRSIIVQTAKESIIRPYQSYHEDSSEYEEVIDFIEASNESAPVPFYSNVSHTKMNCECEMDHLTQLKEKFNLQDNFDYLKRYVKILRQDIERKSVSKLTQSFLEGSFRKIGTSNASCQETCPEPLIVSVPRSPFPATANASDFMFSVSTTYNRLTDPRTSPLDDWSYWLTDSRGHSNGGKLILMLLDAAEDELTEVHGKLSQIGIDADVYHSDSRLEMAVRYLTLVPAMYQHPSRSSKKWLVTCDDDTFFPSMHGLIARFAEFDSTQPLYVGTLSEDVDALEKHGSQAFGGAGVFLSVPLAKTIAENHELCKDEEAIRGANTGWGAQGDILLRNCIYTHTEVRLTALWDLWQLDMYGDPSGFYESGIKPLSLHHYRGSWHVAYPFQSTKLAHLCGEDCTLQRFQTADDFVVSTGFSVAQYPRGIDFDLHQFERTFGPAAPDKGWNLDFMLGPQRPSLRGTGRKWSWDMQESTVNDDGSVTQVYVRKHDDWRWKEAGGEAMGDADGAIELVWFA